MSKKLISTIVVIAGLALLVVSLGADILKIGGDLSVIGWKQLTGAGVGLVIFLIGLFLRRQITTAKK